MYEKWIYGVDVEIKLKKDREKVEGSERWPSATIFYGGISFI